MKTTLKKIVAQKALAVFGPSKQQQQRIIQEIHDSFDTEVEKLLADAKISRSTETTKQDLIAKRNRLVALGFSKTQECVEADAEIQRLSKINQENKAKGDLVRTIEYFSFRYPQYKFITEESVQKICSKYGLIYGEVSRYKGTVPDQNLKHIENFKISEEDECWEKGSRWVRFSDMEYVSAQEAEVDNRSFEMAMEKGDYYLASLFSRSKSPLEIAAPKSDFDLDGMEIKNHQLSRIQVPDPVVLKPVFHNGKKHYLVVTAWGLEASDELVVNQKMN